MEAYANDDQEPGPTGNDWIISRVQELLCMRQGTIFESPAGDCVVIQLHSPLLNQAALSGDPISITASPIPIGGLGSSSQKQQQ
jgi:hypothetical protein